MFTNVVLLHNFRVYIIKTPTFSQMLNICCSIGKEGFLTISWQGVVHFMQISNFHGHNLSRKIRYYISYKRL